MLDHLRGKIQEAREISPTADPLKLAILAGILVTGELFDEKDRPKIGPGDAESEEVVRITDQLIRLLEDSLESSP